MSIIKRLVVAAGVVLVAGSLSIASASPAVAAPCTPASASYGSYSVTVCLDVDQLSPGYPGVGVYYQPHGYVTVCTPVCSTPVSFGNDQTGVAYNTADNSVTFTAGTPIPNACVGSTCTPSTAPGIQVVLFGQSRTATVRVAGTEVPIELPTVCVSSSGLC